MTLAKVQLSQLLAIYGKLLTEKQRDVLSMYCDCVCSLAEIADEVGISRQGVRDAIVKGEASLAKLEDALSLARLHAELSAAIEQNDAEMVLKAAKHFVSKE